MRYPLLLSFVYLLFINTTCLSQHTTDLVTLADADSAYIRKFIRKNDLRLFYGAQGNNLSLGSTRDAETQLNGDIYKNTNDYIGAGITYGWLDGDISYSLRGTTYLKEERSNLTQFKVGFSYTRRNIVFRWFYSDSKGVVISGSDNEFESTPSLQELKMGMQIIYLFNPTKYSYRAAMYQSEYQVKTAGSFLLRVDPFYRNLGAQSGSMIPQDYDVAARFGEQTGLEYVRAPGVLVMPGYGINITVRNSGFFISPIVFAGVGLAQNKYEAKSGFGGVTNVEYAAQAILNLGYNRSRYYVKMQINWSSGYTALDPAYLTTSNLTCVFVGGIRFRNLM